MNKKISLIVMSVVFLLISTSKSNAHPTSQWSTLDHYTNQDEVVCIGAESIGWGIVEARHLGTYQGYYRYTSNVTAEHRAMFEDAIELWSDCTAATMQYSNSAIGIVTEDHVDDTFHAKVVFGLSSNGHVTSWELIINTRYNDELTVMDLAHEIGHIWGLADLYDASNVNKLMYFNASCTATGPTESDIKGFNVITGIHTTHTWKYTNIRKQCVVCDGIKTESHRYVWTDYNSVNHKGTCSSCGVVVYEAHSHYRNAAGNCTRCGRSNVALRIIDQIVEEKY